MINININVMSTKNINTNYNNKPIGNINLSPTNKVCRAFYHGAMFNDVIECVTGSIFTEFPNNCLLISKINNVLKTVI